MIPEAAVVVVANELHDREGYMTSLADSPAYRKAYFMDIARAALEAAAPHMLKAAYDLGFEHGSNEPANPYRTTK